MGRYIIVEDTVALGPSGVTPGSFTNTDLTVNSQGLITAASNGAAPAIVINDLTDVDTTGVILDQILQFDGSEWVNSTLDLNNLSDVIITTPSSGEILVFDGVDWTNSTLAASGALVPADIGVTVEAWDADLDALAALTGTGYIVRTGTGTVANRSIVAGTNSGIVITDGDGVSGDTSLVVDISGFDSVSSINPVFDLLAFYNDDENAMQIDTIENIVLSAVPVLGANNVGVGADVFKQNNAGTLEFREIRSGNSGIIITEVGDNIEISTNDNLTDLGALPPNNNYFIVGDGIDWTVENPSTARISLGLGTVAVNNDTDYIRVDGVNSMTAFLNMGSSVTNRIINLDDPVAPQDAATKTYVDAQVTSGTDAGDGLTRTGTVIDVGAGTGITVDAANVNLDTTFTDARYHTQTVLAETTASAEGAELVGTSIKANLDNAITVEEALESIDIRLPFALSRLQIELTGTWQLDVGAPNVIVDTVNDVEVARFQAVEDVAIYRDLMLPPDFDNTRNMVLYASFAKETATTGTVEMALATQHQRTPGIGADDIVTFSFNDTDVHVISWTINSGSFLPLDTVTLRMARKGTNIGDDHTTGINFFAAFLIQE